MKKSSKSSKKLKKVLFFSKKLNYIHEHYGPTVTSYEGHKALNFFSTFIERFHNFF